MSAPAVDTRRAPAADTRPHPLALYEAALAGAHVVATSTRGTQRLDVASWTGAPDAADQDLLGRALPPVLDVGCGPGRLVATLATRGVPALGIDVSALAVALTRARGAPALRRAVESELPDEGRWGTVLLADGNIGIGGDPARLLARCRELLGPAGLVLVETDRDPDADAAVLLELRSADGRTSRPVPWAYVGARALARIAPTCALVEAGAWCVGGRSFVALRTALSPAAPRRRPLPAAAGPAAPGRLPSGRSGTPARPAPAARGRREAR